MGVPTRGVQQGGEAHADTGLALRGAAGKMFGGTNVLSQHPRPDEMSPGQKSGHGALRLSFCRSPLS